MIVFEGPDGVGKSTLAEKLRQRLTEVGQNVTLESFPGRTPNSLGEWVYSLHHDVKSTLGSNAKQALHIAAHIDAIERIILPQIWSGTTVILDRFYWSTLAYGRVFGANRTLLDHLVAAEKEAWGQVVPDILFLIDRPEALRQEHPQRVYDSLRKAYAELSVEATCKPHVIDTVQEIEPALLQVFEAVSSLDW